MTHPIEAEEDFTLDGWHGPIVGAGLADLQNRTEEAVRASLVDEAVGVGSTAATMRSLVWGGLREGSDEDPVSLPVSVTEKVVNGLTGGATTYSSMSDATDALGEDKISPSNIGDLDTSQVTSGMFGDAYLPSVTDLRDAIYQAITGTSTTDVSAATVKSAIADYVAGVEARLVAVEP